MKIIDEVKMLWEALKTAYLWDMFHRRAYHKILWFEEKIAKKIETKGGLVI